MELLGQGLIEKGVITLAQLNEARRKQLHGERGESQPLGEVLCQLGYATPKQIEEALRVQGEKKKSRELSQPQPVLPGAGERQPREGSFILLSSPRGLSWGNANPGRLGPWLLS